MKQFFYLANPTYGGWITWISHFLLRDYDNKLPVFKIGNKLESKLRPFGFGTKYQNVPVEYLYQQKNPIILALDPNYYDIAQKTKEPILVMHDTAEPKKRLYDFYHSCKRFIVVRKTLQDFMLKEYDLKTEHIEMPFYEYKKSETDWNKKTKAKSMARVEYRKHQEIICEANQIIAKKSNQFIEIHGFKNGMYVYQKLQGLDFPKWYYGAYPQEFAVHNEMLEDCKFLVDMSQYVKDGGGAQYTLLQAIYHDSAIVLHRNWLNQPNSIWKEGHNCFAVDNAKELAELIKESPDTEKICRNAKPILKNHIESRFNF